MKPLCVMAIAFGMLTLAGCSVFEGKPVPPPPPAAQAQEVQRDQTASLTIIDRVFAENRGGPSGAVEKIRAKANAEHARYYQIVALQEMYPSDTWRADAILFK